eukprot:snap_masked-scaffold_5-processed-gene-19.45-mRNA-1 protein AED:0.13 eAED:1.00 QI:0/-1/0/1/-1/1/1/0/356
MSNNEVVCDLPLHGENCEETVFEFYEPISEILRVYGIIQFSLLLLVVFIVLIAYLNANKKQWVPQGSRALGSYTKKEKMLFHQNLYTLLSLFIGFSGLVVYSFNGFLISNDFKSNKGKFTAIIYFASYNLFYLGNFYFLPIMKELMGAIGFTSKRRQQFNIALKFGTLFNYVTIPIMAALVVLELVDLHLFLTVSFLIFDITAGILIFLVVAIMTTVIETLEQLTARYAGAAGAQEKTNKLHTLTTKLKYYRKSVSNQIIFIVLISVPLIVPVFSEQFGVLLFHAVYTTFAATGLLPMFSVYSKFIIPGSDRCLSYNDETSMKANQNGKSLVSLTSPQSSVNDVKNTSLYSPPGSL